MDCPIIRLTGVPVPSIRRITVRYTSRQDRIVEPFRKHIKKLIHNYITPSKWPMLSYFFTAKRHDISLEQTMIVQCTLERLKASNNSRRSAFGHFWSTSTVRRSHKRPLRTGRLWRKPRVLLYSELLQAENLRWSPARYSTCEARRGECRKS